MNNELFRAGRRLEQAGQLEDAAAAYQRLLKGDPGNQEAVGRLLVVYRRLKDYRKELDVVEAALGAVEQRDKAAQEKWIRAHPGAAKLGKEVLRKLGGESMTAFGTDPLVEKLLKRKEALERKVGVRKKVRKVRPPAAAEKKKAAAAVKKEMEAAARRKAAEERKRVEEEKKRAVEEKKKAAEEKKRAAEERKKARQVEKEARAHPSLFVVSLRYLVSLEKIDAVMKKHVAFLDKHFASGEFLVSGRQVPRTGGIIIARGKDRAAVERIMEQDPFVKGKLASVDIVEFVASKKGKGLEGWVRGKKG